MSRHGGGNHVRQEAKNLRWGISFGGTGEYAEAMPVRGDTIPHVVQIRNAIQRISQVKVEFGAETERESAGVNIAVE